MFVAIKVIVLAVTCGVTTASSSDSLDSLDEISPNYDVSYAEGTLASEIDQKEIYYRSWSGYTSRGTVFLVHGMAEHSGRYDELARQLVTSLGVKVVSHDHRAHGRTVCPDGETTGCSELGMLHSRGYSAQHGMNPVELLASDLDLVINYASIPSRPIFILGHSMGSVIVRKYLSSLSVLDSRVAGVILSGVPAAPSYAEYYSLVPVATGITYLRGTFHEAFQETFVTGKFDGALRAKLGASAVGPGSNVFISSDPEEIQKYNDDPFSGHLVDLQLLIDVASTLMEMQNAQQFFGNIVDVPEDLIPDILFICGRNDPVCNFGETATLDAQKMTSIGFHVDELYMGNCRHEMFHERGDIKTEGIALLVSWINLRL